MIEINLLRELKTCAKCNALKPRTDFSPNPNGPLGLASYCRECTNARKREKRLDPTVRAKDAAFTRARNAQRKAVLDKLREVPCTDCEGLFPSFMMQFDHVRGPKEFGVMQGYSKSWDELLAEVAKCEIVCANCHCARTFARRELNKGMLVKDPFVTPLFSTIWL